MNYTRIHILRLLNEYANLEMQHREWTINLKKTYVTPTEFIAEWFDDIFPTKAEDLVDQNEISQKEWEIIKPFFDIFSKFADHFVKNENEIPADMTSYEPWLIVSRKAKELKSSLEELGWKLEK